MITTPHVIIPCAGFGQRFKDAGYAKEKPLIRVGGKRLIDWVLECVPVAWKDRVIFVVRQDQARLADELWDLDNGPGAMVVTIAGPTQGAACTVLAAAVGLPPDEPVMVLNSDQYFKLDTDDERGNNIEMLHRYAMDSSWDGFVLTFPGTGPAWSYAVTNGSNRVVHVIEKKQVSPHATVGVYWWRKAGDLVHSICSMIAVGERTKNEFYLAPSINFLTPSDKSVQIVPVEEFHGLGTPEQVQEFEALLATGWKP